MSINNNQNLVLPNNAKKMLLHTCCAPCSGSIIARLKNSGTECSMFFYNPNIHPLHEYELRKKEYVSFSKKLGIPFIEGDYETDKWFDRIEGLEDEPERGKRCTECLSMRLERTALYAHENNFPVFATTLGLSRWKDINQVNECGHRAAAKYPDLIYWDYNWRKHGGSQDTYKIAKQENFYKQDYCGCIYSLRGT